VTPPAASPRSEWEAFIDVLDRAGQDGKIADVEIPAIGGSIAGKRFQALTAAEARELSRLAGAQGCRGDVFVVMWRDLQWNLKQQRKLDQKRRAKPDSSV